MGLPHLIFYGHSSRENRERHHTSRPDLLKKKGQLFQVNLCLGWKMGLEFRKVHAVAFDFTRTLEKT